MGQIPKRLMGNIYIQSSKFSYNLNKSILE